MNNSQKEHFAGQVRRLRARFVQSVGSALGDVLLAKSLERWIREECGNYRQRIYGPLQTLALFIEQVLSTDHSVSSKEILHALYCPLCRAEHIAHHPNQFERA